MFGFTEFRGLAAKQGFNLVGAVNAQELDEDAPVEHRWSGIWSEVKTIFILATGGREFWESLSPSERSNDHPIDSATVVRSRELQNEVQPHLGETRLVYPFQEVGSQVSFVRLGEAAGLGTSQTVLGYVLHPVFGPWVSFRAALLSTSSWNESSAGSGFDPCGPCAKPCVSACPAMAIGRMGFDSGACGSHLQNQASCDPICLSRAACVVGPEHRYGPEESRHRQSFFKHSLLRFTTV